MVKEIKEKDLEEKEGFENIDNFNEFDSSFGNDETNSTDSIQFSKLKKPIVYGTSSKPFKINANFPSTGDTIFNTLEIESRAKFYVLEFESKFQLGNAIPLQEKSEDIIKELPEDLKPIVKETTNEMVIYLPMIPKYSFDIAPHSTEAQAYNITYSLRAEYLEFVKKVGIPMLRQEYIYSVDIPSIYDAKQSVEITQLIEVPTLTEEQEKIFGKKPPFIFMRFPRRQFVPSKFSL